MDAQAGVDEAQHPLPAAGVPGVHAPRAPNMEMLRVLVEECGVDVNAPSFRKLSMAAYMPGYAQTALGYLAARREYWHLDAIRYLVQRGGADVNIRDADGQTPLFIACDGDRVVRNPSPAWNVPPDEAAARAGCGPFHQERPRPDVSRGSRVAGVDGPFGFLGEEETGRPCCPHTVVIANEAPTSTSDFLVTT